MKIGQSGGIVLPLCLGQARWLEIWTTNRLGRESGYPQAWRRQLKLEEGWQVDRGVVWTQVISHVETAEDGRRKQSREHNFREASKHGHFKRLSQKAQLTTCLIGHQY